MNSIIKSEVLPQLTRLYSTAPREFVNRNPRNLERMTIARKPDGYHLDNPGKNFWHRLALIATTRTVTAQVVHFKNGPIIEARSTEWCLRKQLYSVKDTCAYVALGRVFAQRCLESGITEIYSDIKPVEGGKVEKFLQEIQKAGINLEEPEIYKKPNPWDMLRPEKPWNSSE